MKENSAAQGAHMNYKSVVTSFLQAEGRILLLKRSSKVGTYQGRWAAVSGFLEGAEEPLERAQIEIREEVGLDRDQISLLRAGEALRAFDEQSDTVWTVYPYLFETHSKTIRLDWENTEYEWVDPSELRFLQTVPKLRETFDRVKWNFQLEARALSKVLREVEEVAWDRVHGASFLGRRAIELISAVAETSQAKTSEELFCDLLIVALKLRNVQSAMAIVRNLVGMFLYQADQIGESTLGEYRNQVISVGRALREHAERSAEDAARNAAAQLPTDCHVLTHSYSSNVIRALELASKARKELRVYTTESYPGMEGKKLANDLVRLGIDVKLIADSAVASIIPDINLVLVGADSVFSDGSLLHKVGTKSIATIANEREVPVFSVCETTKFSTSEFLREPTEVSDSLFDVTPNSLISQFITETGSVKAGEVKNGIKVMLRDMYP